MSWMNRRKGSWTCFASIAFVIVVLFFMSAYDVPTAANTLIQSYPAPILVSPTDEETIKGKGLFSWEWDGALQEGEWFDLQIWRFEKPPSSVSIRRNRECFLDTPPDGFGDYRWQVAVVWIDESGSKSPLSESQTGSFFWSDEPPDAVVTVQDILLDLRSGPGTNYDIVARLRQGDCLEVKCKNADGTWLKVACPYRGQGWVLASRLQINRDMSDVPIAQISPTPTPMHTPTPTETPTPVLLPPPILLGPENGAAFLGEPVLLKWRWDWPRTPDEVFSVRVHREGETRLCHHAQARDLEYKGSLTYCTAGTHCWGVTLALRLCGDEADERCWQNLSEPSAERCFYYVPGEEPWTWPSPTPSGGGDDSDGGGIWRP